MARTIPASYPKPNPDLSFVPATGTLDDGSGTTSPPHGPLDLGLAENHLFANGLAGVVIPQIWRKGEEIENTAAGFPANADLIYQIPADVAFTEFHVSIYYLANKDHAEGFKLRCVELNEVITLASESAGESQRVIEADWSPAGIDTWAGDVLTIEVYVKGDASSPNRLCGVFVERNPLTGSVPPGRHYDPEFIGMESGALDQDSPLCSDLAMDLRSNILALKAKRKRIFLQWSRQLGSLAADFGGFLSTLIPVLVTGGTNTNRGTVRALGTATQTLHVCGGRSGIWPGPFTESTELENGTWKSGTATVEGTGLLPIEGPYAQVIAQVGSINPPPAADSLADLRSVSIWGS